MNPWIDLKGCSVFSVINSICQLQMWMMFCQTNGDAAIQWKYIFSYLSFFCGQNFCVRQAVHLLSFMYTYIRLPWNVFHIISLKLKKRNFQLDWHLLWNRIFRYYFTLSYSLKVMKLKSKEQSIIGPLDFFLIRSKQFHCFFLLLTFGWLKIKPFFPISFQRLIQVTSRGERTTMVLILLAHTAHRLYPTWIKLFFFPLHSAVPANTVYKNEFKWKVFTLKRSLSWLRQTLKSCKDNYRYIR